MVKTFNRSEPTPKAVQAKVSITQKAFKQFMNRLITQNKMLD